MENGKRKITNYNKQIEKNKLQIIKMKDGNHGRGRIKQKIKKEAL